MKNFKENLLCDALAKEIAGTRIEQIPKKPLYLLASEKSILLYQSNSLVLKRSEQPVIRFPLLRINRIVANRNIHWSGNALMETLKRKIVISWVSSDSEIIGNATPVHTDYNLDDIFALLVEVKNWHTLYENILRYIRMSILNEMLLNEEKQNNRYFHDNLESLKRKFVYSNEFDNFFSKEIQAWCENHVAQQLIASGLKLSYTALDKTTLLISNDLSNLLFAKFNLENNALIGQEQKINIFFFENWIKKHPFIIADWLGIFEVKFKNGMDIWL